MKKKGDILEELVTLLHSGKGVEIQRNVRLKPNSGKGRPREFDLILSTNVAGYGIKIPIECKNYPNNKIGAPLIDAYIGKLESVGLPVELSVYITSGKYTSDAVERAKQRNVKLLTLDGLRENGFESVIHDLLSQKCIQVCEIKQFTLIHAGRDSIELYDMFGIKVGNIFDIVWNSWMKVFNKFKIGVYDISVSGSNMFQLLDVDGTFNKIDEIFIQLEISCIVVSREGSGEIHLLKDQDGKIEKVNVKVLNENDAIEYMQFNSQNEFENYLSTNRNPKIKVELKANKVKFGDMLWPPSTKYVKNAKELGSVKAMADVGVYNTISLLEELYTDFDDDWRKSFSTTVKKNDAHFILKYTDG